MRAAAIRSRGSVAFTQTPVARPAHSAARVAGSEALRSGHGWTKPHLRAVIGVKVLWQVTRSGYEVVVRPAQLAAIAFGVQRLLMP